MRATSALALVLVSLAGSEPALAQAPQPLALEVVARTSGRFAAPAGSADPGFDAEVLRRFAAWHRVKQGRPVELAYRYVATVPEVLQAMEAGTDVGLGGITATPERDRVVDFSEEVLPVRSVLVAPAGVLDPARWRSSIAPNIPSSCRRFRRGTQPTSPSPHPASPTATSCACIIRSPTKTWCVRRCGRSGTEAHNEVVRLRLPRFHTTPGNPFSGLSGSPR